METSTEDVNKEGTAKEQNSTIEDKSKQLPNKEKEKTLPKPMKPEKSTTKVGSTESDFKQSAKKETEQSVSTPPKNADNPSKGGFSFFGLRKSKSSSTSKTSTNVVSDKHKVELEKRPRAMSYVPNSSLTKSDVTLTDVMTAAYRIRDEIHVTPCEKSVRITEISDYEVYFKREYLQVSGGYKSRGAINALLTLSEKHQERGVLGTSASSHGLALAAYGKKYGVPVTILIPENVHPRKLHLYDKNGAKTHFAGRNDCEVMENAHKTKVEAGLTYIDENENPYVISGIGTLVLEIVDQVDNIDAIIVPVGGGSLLGSACVVIKSLYPQIEIIGVESENCPSFNAAVEAGHPMTIKTDKGATLADGLSSQTIGQLPFDLAKNRVDRVVSVREDQIALAVLRLLEKEKAIVEGFGAAGLAALMGDYLPELKGKRVVVPLCGGNIDPTVLGRAIERGLTADGRMVRFVVKISDRPGALGRLTSLLVSTGVSVKDLYQERTWLNSSIFSIQVKCVAELRNAEHGEELKNVLLQHYKEDVLWNETLDE